VSGTGQVQPRRPARLPGTRPGKARVARSLLRQADYERVLTAARAATRICVTRTLYLRVRHGGWLVILRGTRRHPGPGR
jgi:hypothetical protein